VDGTTQALLLALLGAVLGGGVVLAWRVSDAQMHERKAVEEAAVPAGIATVLSVLRSSALVVDENDEVVKASAPAYAYGLVTGNAVAVQELADLDLTHQALRLGLEVYRFESDLQGAAAARRIRDDFAGGLRRGVKGPPTFFINGCRYDGTVDAESLVAAIDGALAHQR